MNLPKDEVYLKEQHSESFTIWSTSNTVNTEGKSVSCRYIISEPTIKMCVFSRQPAWFRMNYWCLRHKTYW